MILPPYAENAFWVKSPIYSLLTFFILQRFWLASSWNWRWFLAWKYGINLHFFILTINLISIFCNFQVCRWSELLNFLTIDVLLDLQYRTINVKLFWPKRGIFGVMGQNIFFGVIGFRRNESLCYGNTLRRINCVMQQIPSYFWNVNCCHLKALKFCWNKFSHFYCSSISQAYMFF